jgi:Concanavalin A-like lectin/glucanases superfamily
MNKNLCLVLGAVLFSSSAFAGNLKSSIIFQEDCEDLKSSYSGVKISSSIKVLPDGKFGKCFRIERRTVNALANGDFKQKESDAWLYRDNAIWQKKGGRKNSSCLKIDGGEVVIPVTALKKYSANAFSFYAKSSEGASVNIIWECSGKENSLLKDQKIGKSFVRVKAPFGASADSGSLRIQVTGAVIIDNAQIDKGVNFFNSFSTPLKRRGVDMISIPADGRFFKPKQGAISTWLKVPWLNNKDVISNSICGIMVVDNEAKRIKKWGDHVIMGTSCIPRKKITDKMRKSNFNFYTIDAKNRVCPISEKLINLEPAPTSGWRHLAINWQLGKDGKMKAELWLDGKKLIEKAKPFGPVKKQKLMWVGYANGAYLNGLMDDFAILNRPLTEDEIKQINTSNKPLSQL